MKLSSRYNNEHVAVRGNYPIKRSTGTKYADIVILTKHQPIMVIETKMHYSDYRKGIKQAENYARMLQADNPKWCGNKTILCSCYCAVWPSGDVECEEHFKRTYYMEEYVYYSDVDKYVESLDSCVKETFMHWHIRDVEQERMKQGIHSLLGEGQCAG